jgi:hypothetical protein
VLHIGLKVAEEAEGLFLGTLNFIFKKCLIFKQKSLTNNNLHATIRRSGAFTALCISTDSVGRIADHVSYAS